MGLENTHPDIRPDDFNVNWPEGTDDQKYGDDHIRLIKLGTYNFWQDFEKFKVDQGALFTGDKAKKAVQADNAAKFNNETPDKFARVTGDYSGLRARATTKEDVGLNRVPNYYISNSSNSPSTTNFASSLAVKGAYDRAEYAVGLANRVTQAGGVGSMVFAMDWTNNGVHAEFGHNRAGSALQPAGMRDAADNASRNIIYRPGTGRLAGTWKCLGQSFSSWDQGRLFVTTLWVRIS